LKRGSEEAVVADVKCYFCGHVSGQVVCFEAATAALRSFIAANGEVRLLERGGRPLRCARCRGPVFLEETSPFDLPERIEAYIARCRALSAPAAA
jgi:hypothetical protein